MKKDTSGSSDEDKHQYHDAWIEKEVDLILKKDFKNRKQDPFSFLFLED
jgi:hypothetical protein